MYKFYRKDRNQWVEVASFEMYSHARYYANRMGFVQVDNPGNYDNWFYVGDCWNFEDCVLLEPLTDEQIEEIKADNIDPIDLEDDYGIIVCKNCGRLMGKNSYDYAHYVDCVDGWFCSEECMENYDLFYCEDCDEWRDGESYTTREGRTICECCYENSYNTCCECGEIVYEDYCHWDDSGDCYCDNCWEENKGIIGSYHGCRPPLNIHRTNEDTAQDGTFGTEVETECEGSYDRREVAETIDSMVNADEKLFVFEEDGSLSDNGYETISQPFTMRWFYKNRDIFKNMFDKMVSMGCKSHYTDSCGFHIHFGRHFFGNKERECVDRLIYVFEKYKPELEVFSRRKKFNWCRFPSDEYCDWGVDWKDLKDIKVKNKPSMCGHGNVINLGNSNTIEIRLFKGTLNFNTYSASLELVNNITNYVKDKSDEEVENGKFTDIVNYLPTEYLKQYCLDRNII